MPQDDKNSKQKADKIKYLKIHWQCKNEKKKSAITIEIINQIYLL